MKFITQQGFWLCMIAAMALTAGALWGLVPLAQWYLLTGLCLTVGLALESESLTEQWQPDAYWKIPFAGLCFFLFWPLVVAVAGVYMLHCIVTAEAEPPVDHRLIVNGADFTHMLDGADYLSFHQRIPTRTARVLPLNETSERYLLNNLGACPEQPSTEAETHPENEREKYLGAAVFS
jgi:hypothetical protein